MRRDDWKYFDDAWDESNEEEKAPPGPPEKQCRNCLHWIDREALYCSWCGKEQEETGKP
jgi:hypothetical protein